MHAYPGISKMNKIKEIQDELFWNYYSFVNSDQKNWLLNFVSKKKNDKTLTKSFVAFYYTIKIVNSYFIGNTLTNGEVVKINNRIRREFQKENRCKMKIRKEQEQGQLIIYTYMIKDVGTIIARSPWRVI